jgi:hypothetical protein
MSATQQGEGFPHLPYLHCFGTDINGGFQTNVVNTRGEAVWELSQIAPFNRGTDCLGSSRSIHLSYKPWNQKLS